MGWKICGTGPDMVVEKVKNLLIHDSSILHNIVISLGLGLLYLKTRGLLLICDTHHAFTIYTHHPLRFLLALSIFCQFQYSNDSSGGTRSSRRIVYVKYSTAPN